MTTKAMSTKMKAKAPKPHPTGIRIGTLARPRRDYIDQIKQHGFESFSLVWGDREAASMNTRDLAPQIHEALVDTDAVISSLAIYGNALDPGNEHCKAVRAAWKQAIRHAHLFGCDIVAGFTGRLIDKPIEASLGEFKRFFGPLARFAADHGVRIVFENCSMGGNWERGGWNIAHDPVAWEMMFNEVPADNLGLQWEPCHQMGRLIDPIAQLRKWAPKVFHVHGKDATIAWDVIREYGISGVKPFAWHRTPGFGDSNWTDIITILRQNGYVGSIDIEGWHDPVYRGELEMTGQVRGLNYLKDCRGGGFVTSPL